MCRFKQVGLHQNNNTSQNLILWVVAAYHKYHEQFLNNSFKRFYNKNSIQNCFDRNVFTVFKNVTVIILERDLHETLSFIRYPQYLILNFLVRVLVFITSSINSKQIKMHQMKQSNINIFWTAAFNRLCSNLCKSKFRNRETTFRGSNYKNGQHSQQNLSKTNHFYPIKFQQVLQIPTALKPENK